MVVESSSKPNNNTMMAHVVDISNMAKMIDQETEHTTSLEEDERMCAEEDDLSQFADFERGYTEDDDDDDISCPSIHSDDVDDPIWGEGATRVRFAPMVAEYFIMPLDEYTQDEIDESWWTDDEREAMSKAYFKTVERIEAGLEEKRSSEPYRGLENTTSECSKQVMIIRKAYVDIVMDELEKQWGKDDENELLDWEKMASLTSRITKQSAHEAIVMAMNDEYEASVAYQVNDNDMMEQQELHQLGRSELDFPLLLDNELHLDLIEVSERTTSQQLESSSSSIRITRDRGLIVSPMKTKKKKIEQGRGLNVSPVKTIKKKIKESRLGSSYIRIDEDEGKDLAPTILSPNTTTKTKKINNLKPYCSRILISLMNKD